MQDKSELLREDRDLLWEIPQKVRVIAEDTGRDVSKICPWSDAGVLECESKFGSLTIRCYPPRWTNSYGHIRIYVRVKQKKAWWQIWKPTYKLELVFNSKRCDIYIPRIYKKDEKDYFLNCISVFRKGDWIEELDEAYRVCLERRQAVKQHNFASFIPSLPSI